MLRGGLQGFEDRRKGTGTPGGSHHVRMVDYTDAQTVSQWDGWAHRRLRLGWRIVGGGCLDDAESSQVEPARRLVLLRSELLGSSLARFRVRA